MMQNFSFTFELMLLVYLFYMIAYKIREVKTYTYTRHPFIQGYRELPLLQKAQQVTEWI